MNAAAAPLLPAPSRISRSYSQLGITALFGLAITVLYGHMIAGLAHEWWTNPDYSHGLLAPFAVGYLVYRKKQTLLNLPVVPSGWGLFAIVFSQAVNLLGNLGAEFFLQRFSLVLFVAGTIVFVWSWRHLLELSFPLVILTLAIPLPVIVFNALALPLQLIASSWAEGLLRLCSIPVYRDGNVLTLASQALNVSEACSGIRSLVSLLTLATIVAYFMRTKWWWRAVLVLSSVPIAMVANSCRIAGTGILTLWFGPSAAEGFYHAFSGWVVFLIAFALLSAESVILQRFSPICGRESSQQ